MMKDRTTSRSQTRPAPIALEDWPHLTRTEGGWFNRPYCPLIPRSIIGASFLRNRLHVIHGAQPLPPDLTDDAVDATLRLMLRRGK
ncbi:hypothetical protein [Azospirillum sp.]|uniref:hypothetical protein n=1 Tax=Azospirillum sp. TaxID=34012 RepID=UPI0026088921|nr:hypothetical protein [Azospirillum sp.]